MVEKTITMTNKLYDYMLNCSLRENSILQELREITSRRPDKEMQISPEQGQFMAFLIKTIQAKKALEIGVFTGYSSLAVALALPENGKIIACDNNEEVTNIAKTFWQKANVAHKVDLHLGLASETLQKFIEEEQADSFDFAFIDADKIGYINYYEQCLKLLRKGGLIALDNMFRGGDVADSNTTDERSLTIRLLQQKILTDDRVDTSLVPIADGLMLIRKR